MEKTGLLTVTDLTNAIKRKLEPSFSGIAVQGEVVNFKVQSSGHLYFSLKDAYSQISAVMFRTDVLALKSLPKDGDQVSVQGDINVYPQRGSYQLVIKELALLGVGQLLLKLEALKRKLHEKGWFSKAHKKPLPHLPRRIGIVTSPTGAVIQDILQVLSRRFSSVHVILNPVKVQGEGAAQEIAQAIEQFNRYQLADVLIVGRGGGSLEDLWAFNEEIVAAAIFHSKIPIICAVGHETDHCIAEYVADVRAPTPSAAAELVMAEKNQQQQTLRKLEKGIALALSHQIKHHKQQLQYLAKHALFNNPYGLLGGRFQLLDDIKLDLEEGIARILDQKKQKLDSLRKQKELLKPSNQLLAARQRLLHLEQAITTKFLHHFTYKKYQVSQIDSECSSAQQRMLERARQKFPLEGYVKRLQTSWEKEVRLLKAKLQNIAFTLHAIDPKNLTKKGYSILFSEKTNSVINSIHSLAPHETITILLSDGKAKATVTSTISNKD